MSRSLPETATCHARIGVADAQGVYAPTHLEDEPHADLRREGAMLPALKQALCAANKK